MTPRCFKCHRTPAEIEEYVAMCEDGESPDEYVRREEGTYNPENGHFACTKCYVAIGMPSRSFPRRWVAP